MGFQTAAMSLGLAEGGHFLDGHHPTVDPGRKLIDRPWLQILENQMQNDGLHPGGTGFVGRGDDNIVVARPDVIPTGAVQKMILIDVLDPGQ